MYTDDWTGATNTTQGTAESSPTTAITNNKPATQEHETPARTNSHDMFEGDLFGDDLMEDIYNSSVAEDEQQHNEYIETLLGPREEAPPTTAEKEATGATPGETGRQDGFGAFRPSTSFNDLTTILPTKASSKTTNDAPPGETCSEEGKVEPTKKRKISNAESGGGTKKKTAQARPASRKTTALNDVATEKSATPAISASNCGSAIKKELALLDVAVATEPTAASDAAAVAPLADELMVTVDRVPSKIIVKPTASTVGTSSHNSRDKTNYKTLAQAAVSSLISTAKSDVVKMHKGEVAFTGKVDTSTAHVKALTGNNWVTASASVSTIVAPVTTTSIVNCNDAKANAERARARQILTADDRAKQNRDRNREHARNTRLRKKAYVDELKRTLIEIVNQRDASEAQKKQVIQRDLEQREVRFRVSEEFLKLRGRNETSESRWNAILEDEFSLTLPVTRYRDMVESDWSAGNQQVVGVTATMADASHLFDFMQTLSENSAEVVTLQYHCDRKDFFMDGCFAVQEWEAMPMMGSEPMSPPLAIKGNFRAKFSPSSNKLISAKIAFDTGTVGAMVNGRSNEDREDAGIEAANQANAILDSLDMPQMVSGTRRATVVPNTASEASYKGEEESSDESVTDLDSSKQESGSTPTSNGITTRRSQRLAT